MTSAAPNPQEALREEILADAKQQVDRILHHAKEQAGEIAAKAKADADRTRRQRLDAAKAEAVRRRELVLSTVLIEATRRRAARVEEVLESIRQEAARRLVAREGYDYRRAMTALAVEAASRLSGGRVILELSEADRRNLGDAWLDEVRRRLNRSDVEVTMAAEPAKIGGGLVARDPEGRQVYDNSLEGRLERLWPHLRREIAARTSLVPVDVPQKES